LPPGNPANAFLDTVRQIVFERIVLKERFPYRINLKYRSVDISDSSYSEWRIWEQIIEIQQPESEEPETLPAHFELLPLYPNPFNPIKGPLYINIRIHSGSIDNLTLSFFNIHGQEIYERILSDLTEGTYKTSWSGKDLMGHVLPAGVYFLRLKDPKGHHLARKFIIVQ
jgi:hypothetical protein